ncbi:MAG: apolipoprotein acyltransferase [Rubripirellula sp.]
MPAETLIQRFHDLAGIDGDTAMDADSLIGFFQVFRPDGRAVQGLFEDIEVGDQLEDRLEQLYVAAGDDRRPTGGRDAYFVVRNPAPLDPNLATQHATTWLQGLRELAVSLGDVETANALEPTPSVRVLEGLPPKHPKDEAEKSNLLRVVQQDVPLLVERIDSGPFTEVLRPAFYFVACDAMLRDYLMWPFYARAAGIADPFSSYFELWRHGVKYRIFGESQVDVYLPRQTD